MEVWCVQGPDTVASWAGASSNFFRKIEVNEMKILVGHYADGQVELLFDKDTGELSIRDFRAKGEPAVSSFPLKDVLKTLMRHGIKAAALIEL
jgi:hypothetical protein